MPLYEYHCSSCDHTYDTLRSFVIAVEQATDEDGNDMFFAIEGVRLADSTDSGRELNLSVALSTYFHDPDLAVTNRTPAARGRPRG